MKTPHTDSSLSAYLRHPVQATLPKVDSASGMFTILATSLHQAFMVLTLPTLLILGMIHPLNAQDPISPVEQYESQHTPHSFSSPLSTRVDPALQQHTLGDTSACSEWAPVEFVSQGAGWIADSVVIGGVKTLVILSNSGIYHTSLDGIHWDMHTTGGNHILTTVASNEDVTSSNPTTHRYVLGGRNATTHAGVVLTSSDFETWTEHTLIPIIGSVDSGNISRIAFGNPGETDTFVAVGSLVTPSSNIPHLFVSHDGHFWREHEFRDALTVPSNITWIEEIGEFFASGGSQENGNSVSRSPDGIFWFHQDFDTVALPITFSPTIDEYVRAASYGSPDGPFSLVWTSFGGVFWSEPVELPTALVDITFTGSEFIATGITSVAPHVSTINHSVDAVNWTTVNLPDVIVDHVVFRHTPYSTIFLTTGFDDGFEEVVYRQECFICELGGSIDFPIQTQGINPITFTAETDCLAGNASYTWTDEDQNILATDPILTIDPEELQALTHTTVYTLTITDDARPNGAIQLQATILVSSNPILADPNQDGSNTIQDLWTVGVTWNTSNTNFDADEDQLLTILDLLYVPMGSVPTPLQANGMVEENPRARKPKKSITKQN